jgi:hypothetical protein
LIGYTNRSGLPAAKRTTSSLPAVTQSGKISFVATGDGERDILRDVPYGRVNEGGAERVSCTDRGAAGGGVPQSRKFVSLSSSEVQGSFF